MKSEKTESVRISSATVNAARKQVRQTKQSLGGYIGIAVKEKINRKKPIKTLNDIDYLGSSDGRLLFTALTILTTHNYRDKTPDEVIGILNDSSTFIDNRNNETH